MTSYQKLASNIIDATKDLMHTVSVAKAIETYLIDNTKIIVSYSGIIPGTPPIPDPVVTDVLKISGICSPLVNTDFNAYVKSIEIGITSGFLLDIGSYGITPIIPTFAFLPGLDLIQDHIRLVHENNLNDPQKPIWEEISKRIINWLEKSSIGMSFSSQNIKSGSSGSAIITKIEIT